MRYNSLLCQIVDPQYLITCAISRHTLTESRFRSAIRDDARANHAKYFRTDGSFIYSDENFELLKLLYKMVIMKKEKQLMKLVNQDFDITQGKKRAKIVLQSHAFNINEKNPRVELFGLELYIDFTGNRHQKRDRAALFSWGYFHNKIIENPGASGLFQGTKESLSTHGNEIVTRYESNLNRCPWLTRGSANYKKAVSRLESRFSADHRFRDVSSSPARYCQ